MYTSDRFPPLQLSLLPLYAPSSPLSRMAQPQSLLQLPRPDHGNSLDHFINGSWVRPEGRKTYDTYNPATGEKLASTVQGQLTTISLWNFCYISSPNLHLCHILTPSQPHTSLHVLQSIMSVCVSDCHLTPLPLGVQEDADVAVSAARKAFDSLSRLPGHVRARHMYSIGRHVQKHAR